MSCHMWTQMCWWYLHYQVTIQTTMISDSGFPHKFLWKIKIFLWLMVTKIILTRDNLLRSGWKGSKCCVFYGQDESIDHLRFQCSLARLVWSFFFKCVFDLRTITDSLNVWFGVLIFFLQKIAKKCYSWCLHHLLDHLEMQKCIVFDRKWLVIQLFSSHRYVIVLPIRQFCR